MEKYRIAVIGMGYVGVPIAMAFSDKYKVVGFDIQSERITALSSGIDHTGEAGREELLNRQEQYLREDCNNGLLLTNDPYRLADCNVYIVTVPTPVDTNHQPDLRFVELASETVALTLAKDDIVIYESTVYPGFTEEIAVPILEKGSGFTLNRDFYCGYSPERINPGDTKKTVRDIMKITSGSTPASAKQIDELYRSVIRAGTYPAPSIKVAEAAKVIENTQRDVNIAFVNELSRIFGLLGINTQEVLKAAATKWNFLPFQPGLVGGHCIGVDPYYLAHKAITVGYRPELILAARKINDGMGHYVAGQVLQLMAQKQIPTKDAEVLVLGISFKENFSDVRNSRVVDIIRSLQACHLDVTVADPFADPAAVKKEYAIESYRSVPENKKFAAVIVAVNHSPFTTIDYRQLLLDPGVLYDVKSAIHSTPVDGAL